MQTKLLQIKRLMYDFNQDQIADLLGMCRYTYIRKENGVKNFSQDEIKQLIEILHLSNDEVCEIFFTDEMTDSNKEG